MPNHPARVTLDSDGSLLAVGNILSKTVRVYELPSLRLAHEFGRPGSVEALSFSAAKSLAVGHSFSRLVAKRNSIRIWSLKAEEPLFEPPGLVEGKGPENDVTSLDFAPKDERLAVALTSHHAKRECCYLFLFARDLVPQGFGDAMAYAVRFSPSGENISEGGFGGVRLWTGDGKRLVWAAQPYKPPASALAPPVGSIAFSPDGARLVVGQAYGSLPHAVLLDAKTGVAITNLDLKATAGRVLTAFDSSGRWIIAATGARVYTFSASTFDLLQTTDLPSKSDAVTLSTSKRGSLAAIGMSNGQVFLIALTG